MQNKLFTRFFSVVMLTLMSVGNVWADNIEDVVTFSALYGNATLSGIESKSSTYCTFSYAKNAANTAVAFNKDGDVRLYNGSASGVGCSMTITPNKGTNDEDLYTIVSVTLSQYAWSKPNNAKNYTIGGTPSTGETFDSGNATWTGNANSVTITNTTTATQQLQIKKITVVLAPISNTGGDTPTPTTYTVTLDAGSGSCSTTSLTEASAGAGVTLPDATPVTGWTFAGWATAAVSETTTAPTFVDSQYHPSEDVTLYAVYSKSDVGSSTKTSTFNVQAYAAANSWVNGTAYNGFTIEGVTYSQQGNGNNSKYYSTDNSWRFYKDGTVVLTAEGNIQSVTSTPSQEFTISGTTATCSLSATVKFTSIAVTYTSGTTTYNSNPTVSEEGGEDPTPDLLPANLAFAAPAIECIADDMVEVAFSQATDAIVTFTSSDATVAEYTEGTLLAYSAGTATITATCPATATHAAGTATLNVTVVPNITNTAETAYTIAEAKALIDAGQGLDQRVYVKGTVSEVVSYNSNYHSITYWIGDGQEFQIYGGLSFQGTVFTSTNDLSVGDEVIVCGKLKKFNDTYELDLNNYLVKHLKVSALSIANAMASQGSTINPTITTNNTDDYTITYTTSNSEVVSVSNDGKTLTAVNAGIATITATMPATDYYQAATTTFTVTVTSASSELVGIEITGTLDKATYYYGEEFDYTGLTVTALYNDNAEVDITDLVTWEHSINMQTLGTRTEYVAATFGEETEMYEVSITVLDKLTGITLNTENAKTSYYIGEEFSAEGLVITATYLSTTEEYTSDDFIEEMFSFTGYDMSVAGKQTVTVTLADCEETKTATYTITVKDPRVDVITADCLAATNTNYTDFSGVVVSTTAVYAGNSAKEGENIQLRSKNSNSGIVTTSLSTGVARRITIVFADKTSDNYELDIYGNHSAYNSAADLYNTAGNTNQGTKIGSVVKKSGNNTYTIALLGNYEYIGLRSKNGAIYLVSITIEWGDPIPTIKTLAEAIDTELQKPEGDRSIDALTPIVDEILEKNK